MKYSYTKRVKGVYLLSSALLIASVFLGLLVGATAIGFSDIIDLIFGGGLESPAAKILFFVRLPRTLASLLCGAALAVSGAVIQAALSNDLASPSIIGVNSGAGLAVTLLSAFGVLGGVWISLGAFVGAFFAVALVSLGSKRWGASKGSVILIGVAMNALLGAFSDTVFVFFPEVAVLGNDFRIGDFSFATYSRIIPAGVLILMGLAALFMLTNELDVLTLGDDNARGLGLNSSVMRCVFLLLSALLSGAAVSVGGLISFVGLLVPHFVRRVAGGSSRTLLPLSAIVGAGFVTVCDTVSRVIFAPYEIPVGIILAFLGAPFFIYVLVGRRGGEGNA